MPQQHPASHPSSSGDVAIGDLDLVPQEYAILMASRYYFASFAQPADHSWMAVILGSQDFFPVGAHAEIVRAVLAMVQDIRLSRRSTLRFSNPHCRHCAGVVTAEERHLVLMIRALASSATSKAQMNAMMLCEGNPTVGLIEAARRLVVLAAVESAQSRSAAEWPSRDAVSSHRTD